MRARRFSVTALIGLILGYTGPSTLQHVNPQTLAGQGTALRIPGGITGYAWARRYGTLAVMLRGAGVPGPVEIVDAARLRVRRVVPMGEHDVCGMAFVGPTLFALTAEGSCYGANSGFSVIRIDAVRGRVTRVTPVAGLGTVYPVNVTLGDGHAYVARGGGGIDSVDLRTGTVVSHTPQRTLAKGEGIVYTRWLGQHRVGAGNRVVNVRTWRSRVLLAGATVVAPAGRYLVATGHHGGAEYTQSGRFVRRILGDEDVTTTWTVGNRIYAFVGEALDVVDLATGKTLRVVPEARAKVLLAP
jgi:hypothetical protein